MLRSCYFILLRLHPRMFRARFAEEMLGIFDDASRSGMRCALFFDALISLFRQWVLRLRNFEPIRSAATPATAADVPLFHTFDSSPPPRSALVNGAIMSVISFGLVGFAIGHGGGNFPRLMIGALYPRPHVLPVERSSIKESEPTTRIKVASPAIDPLYQLADVYFRIIRVLAVLDADGDRILSAWEIITARSPLNRLDLDGDGKLSPEECGFFLGERPEARLDAQFIERARVTFMRMNPVLAALDTDRNGEISTGEIEASPVALRALDRNGDGSLTPAEVLPEAGDNRTLVILSRLDQNGDLKISRQERHSEAAKPLREILDRADRNEDGVVTAAELRKELQLSDELKKRLEKAVNAIHPAR